MITNVSLVTIYVTDQDEAKRFYVDVLGFEERADVSMGADTGPGDDFRWVTVGHPSQPELDVTLMVPGPPQTDEMATSVRRALADGSMSGLGLTTDDCRKTYEALTAKGVHFVQEPAERPWGVEAVMRDNSGNWLVIVEPREFSFDLPG